MYYLIESGQEPQALSEAQKCLIDFVLFSYDTEEMVSELNLMFEIVLFNSDVPIDRKEKDALLTLKQFSELLNKISE